MTEKKQIAIQYNLFRWGPCLVKLKIEDHIKELFLKEAEASKVDFETKLAGIVNKQVAFRDYKKFEVFFSGIFDLYSDALSKWTSSADRVDYKQIYSLDALWCNWQGPGDFNPPHDHGGALSWVIYLKIPEELKEENKKYKGRSAGPGGITFIYGDGPRESVTHHSFFPEEGDIFVFPAWLKHWVFPFKSNCTRISVSGNVSDSIKVKQHEKEIEKIQKMQGIEVLDGKRVRRGENV